MENELLRLFNAVQTIDKNQNFYNEDILKRTVRNGYVLSPSIYPNPKLLDSIEKIIGLSGEKANASFHKSWKVVRDSSIEELVLQQIIHYITTYGFEALGIYKQEYVYIPDEELKLSKIKDRIPLVVIKAMTSKEVLDNIIKLGSKIALSKTTLTDIMAVVKGNKFNKSFVEEINNRELKTLLFDYYDICPTDPIEYLRFVIAKLCNESLLIKNKYLISKIKLSDGKVLDKMLSKSPKNLASIFLRYKPLFLAMKSISNNKTFFNRLRKDADSMHVALPTDYLNDVTSQIKHKELDFSVLESFLEKANIFRKIRLAYALNYRLNSTNSIVYKIRNGKGWTTDFKWKHKLEPVTQDAFDVVINSIANNIRKNVNGKVIYIPKNMHYTLPATEKQFSGNIPSGSYATVPDDMIVGIHWENTKERVDLDFSMMDESGKYGWDARYRSDDYQVLFSGDVVDAPAPNGASEMYYMKKVQDTPKSLFVNYFNFSDNDVVRCKLFVANERPKDFKRNYMVNINNIVATANIEIDKKQNIVGLIVSKDGENRLYFSNTSIGNSITSRENKFTDMSREFMIFSLMNAISLETVLTLSGAVVVHEKPEKDFIDLSPEALDKLTIINLMQ
jgi:hypothetical protein